MQRGNEIAAIKAGRSGEGVFYRLPKNKAAGKRKVGRGEISLAHDKGGGQTRR